MAANVLSGDYASPENVFFAFNSTVGNRIKEIALEFRRNHQ
jgi:hypothetical protein